MRCRTSIWLAAVLVAATSALVRPMHNSENNLLSDVGSGGPAGENEETPNASESVDTEPTTTMDDTTTTDITESNIETTTFSQDEGAIRDETFIVETNFGLVRGFPWQENENIIGYYDIPYGNLNGTFQAATATEKWEYIHEVQEHEKRCPQIENDGYVGDTDCLTLSIFKPRNAENASVLFHIHAENFVTGSGDPSIYGPDYLVDNGIIIVLPNYRLGPLGFLCMQNETVPGNMALKDLSMALSWIHDNIAAFGGDPYSITVSGEGKSGALAGLLALYPKSKGNVQKVITESGSFLSYWSLDREPVTTATDFLERIKTIKNTRDLSLENLDVETIVTAAKGIEFKPCLEISGDDAFMTVTPYATLSQAKIETSFLIGSAMYAGAHEALEQTEASIKKLNDDFTLLLPNDLQFPSESLREQTGQRVKTQYFGEEPIELDNVYNISLCFTDIGYLGPGIRSARLLVAAGATVYFYEFAFAGELNRELWSLDRPVQGAVRGDIIGYLFTQDGVPCKEKQVKECKMVGTLTQMWTNFLKTGSPSTESVTWNKLEKTANELEEWLLIDSELCMQKGLHVNRIPLWTEIYNEHFIDRNRSREVSSSAYIVILFQCIFFLTFCRNVAYML